MNQRRMFWLVACCLMTTFYTSATVAWASEPNTGTDRSLAKHLDQLDELDARLRQAQQDLERTTTWRTRRRIQAKIRQLDQERERLLDRIEEALQGSPRRTDKEAPTTAFEAQLERHRQRHEVIRDSGIR